LRIKIETMMKINRVKTGRRMIFNFLKNIVSYDHYCFLGIISKKE